MESVLSQNVPRGTQESIQIETAAYTFENKNYIHAQLQSPSNGDIVPTVFICLIDISGSMGSEAALYNSTEQHGFTRLDLVKHALKTIIQSIDSKHYLALIPFSTKAKVDLKPLQMNKAGKIQAENIVNKFKPTNSTNIWDALKQGLNIANSSICLEKNIQIILLTDGVPNENPKEGIPAALTNYLKDNKLRGTINTFGFGYELDSKLLEDIATIGLGQYSFIPDATFVGTIFVNFLANSLSTYLINKQVQLNDADSNQKIFSSEIGSIQYDQPKDYLIEIDSKVKNVIVYFGNKKAQINVQEKIQNANDTFYYLWLRNYLINLMQNLINNTKFPESEQGIKQRSNYVDKEYEKLKKLCQSSKYQELLNDLNSTNPDNGQITKSVSRLDWYREWGAHYLRSLTNSHILQICNNFKDRGVQLYAGQIFNKFRDLVEDIFVKIKAPEPSIKHEKVTQVSNMADYYDCYGGCFDGYGNIVMNDGSMRQVKTLKKGDIVKNGYKIQCIFKTKVQNVMEIVNINGLIITSWHPIIYNNEWQFPINVKASEMRYVDYLYNIIFETGHIAEINGIPVVGLGHGITGNAVIEHDYFGTQNVINDLKQIQGWDEGLVEIEEYKYSIDKQTGKINSLKLTPLKIY